MERHGLGADMADSIEMLMDFGLTRLEARIYILLLTDGQLSGYEAAKRTGVSRSNVYTAMAGLVEKGAAVVAEEQSVHYQAVPIKEFSENHIRKLEEISSLLKEQLPESRRETDNYITIRGMSHVKDKFRNMIESVEYRMYLSASAKVILTFYPEIKRLLEEEKKVVLMTDRVDAVVNQFPGAILYERIQKDEQVRLITDSSFALTGRMTKGEDTNFLFSSNPNLVQLLKDALANEIQLIEMK